MLRILEKGVEAEEPCAGAIGGDPGKGEGATGACTRPGGASKTLRVRQGSR